jgi:hypothetical protein
MDHSHAPIAAGCATVIRVMGTKNKNYVFDIPRYIFADAKTLGTNGQNNFFQE